MDNKPSIFLPVIFCICMILFGVTFFSGSNVGDASLVTANFVLNLDRIVNTEIEDLSTTNTSISIHYDNDIFVYYYLDVNSFSMNQELVVTGSEEDLEPIWTDIVRASLNGSSFEDLESGIQTVKTCGTGSIGNYQVSFTGEKLTISLN